MSKKEVCLSNKSFAYYSGFGGLEFNHIEYGIEDYIYCTSGAWNGSPKYHKLKVYYGADDSYVMLYGYKVPFSDVIRM